MCKIIVSIFLVLTFLCSPAIGEIITVTHTVKQTFGGSQSLDDARISTITKAKREALEMASTYIESLILVQNFKVEKDEILALTAGILKAEVISQKIYTTDDADGIEIVANVVVDTSVLEERVKILLQDRTHMAELKETQKREKELLRRVAQLEEENRKLSLYRQSTEKLEEQFQQTSQDLMALDWVDKSLALFAGGKFTDPQKAIEYLNKAIKLQPDAADVYFIRATAYYDLGQPQLAIKDYNEAIRLKPDYASAYYNRGNAYASFRQYERASKDYNEAIHLEPNYAMAYYSLGNAYLKLGQPQRAIEDYNEVIRLEPNYASAYYSQGNAYASLRQYERASKDYNEAIRLEPNYAMAYYNRGNAYLKLGQPQRAIEDYNEAIRLEPNYAMAYYNKACCFALQKNSIQACNWLRLAIERGYNDWQHIEEDKDFDNIRYASCFIDLIKELEK
jgi:tetratricopeptide (TPR) repeat protein